MTGFLDKAYGLDGVDDTRDMYDAWAATYEAEVADNGYATPGRCAEALLAHMDRADLPILDFGCGTGLSGLALATAGFTMIDGCDISAEMLDVARAKPGLYRNLHHYDPANGVPFAPGDYHAVAAIGVIGSGAAPVEVLDQLIDALDPEALLVFSFNDHTLADPSFEGRLNARIADGSVELLFKEYGDHLPGRDMKSNVYVLKRL
ncbi:class I SAM-dependent DNA methyltransferase [Pseudaestuariivita atlantica]|uniref:Methyltransferase type 11 n=1 Tax=Pseudaestuariivita atlantica TaxID=1317121 RepID=A0A0L1JUT5_9RHOB|nr:class I SAM-dependent methyltransferase [Pseudaestuariivita atlantica]KNG95539.1 methyltransferase type 11 [Pseudaestuariivita atlantica]